MKLYALTEDQTHIATFDADLNYDDKIKIMKLIDYVCSAQRLVLEFDNYDDDSIKKSLAVFNYLAPSQVEVDYDSIRSFKIPFVKKSESEKDERYREVYRANAIIKEYPFIYYLLFDEEENIGPNVVTNIINYIKYQNTPEMDKLAAKLRIDTVDYKVSDDYKYKIIQQFFKSLKISLKSVDFTGNNLDERLLQANQLREIGMWLEENYEYYHDEVDEEETEEDYEYNQEKNIKSYTLGKL